VVAAPNISHALRYTIAHRGRGLQVAAPLPTQPVQAIGSVPASASLPETVSRSFVLRGQGAGACRGDHCKVLACMALDALGHPPDVPWRTGNATAPPPPPCSYIGTPLYFAVELGELLVILAMVDAAYSGDWSRIGAISKGVAPLACCAARCGRHPPLTPTQRLHTAPLDAETEEVLQKIVTFIAVAHTGTGAAAGWLAQQRGADWALPALKGFLFGALGLYEETSRRET